MLFESLLSLLVTCVAVGGILYIWVYFVKNDLKHPTLKEPPGPWGLPIWGHLLFFGKNPGMTFMKWAKIYGPILSVKFGCFRAVVLNDAKTIKEAFNLDAFAGRARINNLVKSANMKGVVFIDGPNQIEQRKFTMRVFKKGEGFLKSEFEFKAVEEISNFLQNLQNQCKNAIENQKPNKMMIHHFFQYPVLNSVWVSVVGHKLSEEDPRMKNLAHILENLTDTSSSFGAQMSFFFPWVSNTLSFFGRNCVVNAFNTVYSFMGEQIEKSRENYIAGEPTNFTHEYFDEVSQTTNPLSSFYAGKEQKFTTGDIFLAASDTTTVSLDWLLLYMAREPHVQKKLQAEIDEILSFGVTENDNRRTPTIADRPNMPYAEAVIKEVLRISSVTPLGVFHRTLEDVDFNGYRIPKDTMVVANTYGIHHDSEIWSEPDSFQPERFLNNAGRKRSISKPAGVILPFGFGKRNCIGEGFARDQLFLMTTHFFQKFTVSHTDKIPSLDYVYGIVVGPQPFELLIRERQITNDRE